MRILVAPDKFAGTLTAVEAAQAIAVGWRRQAPEVEVVLAPMSDGGPGFVDVLHASLGGDLLALTVSAPDGSQAPAAVLVAGSTAYVEAAQACGDHLVGAVPAERASSGGVGALLRAAVDAGAERIVVGLGGVALLDGGAGLLGALGARADGPLDAGAEGLAAVTEVDLAPARAALAGVEVVVATDVDIALTGLFGAARTLGDRCGLDEAAQMRVDGRLEQWATVAGRRASLDQGAGAAGGLGFALLLLGAHRVPGVGLVSDAVGLAARARECDLVVTGEGAFDFSSRAGKVPAGVAAVASEALRPCVALAGQVLVGAREMRALGMDAAYSLVEAVGEERAHADPAGALADLAARVARTWSS